MSPDERGDLARRARRAYELGRLRAASRIGVWVLPAAALAIAFGGRPLDCACLALLLLATAVFVRWYGRGYDRAIAPGMLAGVLPMGGGLLESKLEWSDPAIPCLLLCSLGVLAGGAVALHVARRPASGGRKAALVGLFIAAGMASLGCLSGPEAMVPSIVGIAGGAALLGGLRGTLRRGATE